MPDVEKSENASGGSTEIAPIDGMPSETTGEPDMEEDAPDLPNETIEEPSSDEITPSIDTEEPESEGIQNEVTPPEPI